MSGFGGGGAGLSRSTADALYVPLAGGVAADPAGTTGGVSANGSVPGSLHVGHGAGQWVGLGDRLFFGGGTISGPNPVGWSYKMLGSAASFQLQSVDGAGNVDVVLAHYFDFSGLGAAIACFKRLAFGSDNSFDIGTAAADRPRHIYAGSDVVAGAQLRTLGAVTAAAGDRVNIGTLAAIPASGEPCIVARSTGGIASTTAGDLVLVPAGSTGGAIHIYSGTGTPARRWTVTSTGGLVPATALAIGTAAQPISALQVTFGGGVYLNAVRIIGDRRAGWATPTGTATRTTFDTATVTTAQLAERVKALIDDLHATAGHGIIGT